MTLKRTQSCDRFNYIFYGSNQKPIPFNEFFNILSELGDDDDDDDDDETPPPPKKEDKTSKLFSRWLPI
jgi:hypothetical protein